MRYETKKQHEFRQVISMQTRAGGACRLCVHVCRGWQERVERDRRKEKSGSQIIPFYVSGWRSCVFKQAEITSGLSLF